MEKIKWLEKVGNREVKEVDHFKYLERLLPREIKMRIVMATEAFIRKIALMTSKLCIELGKKLVKVFCV